MSWPGGVVVARWWRALLGWSRRAPPVSGALPAPAVLSGERVDRPLSLGPVDMAFSGEALARTRLYVVPLAAADAQPQDAGGQVGGASDLLAEAVRLRAMQVWQQALTPEAPGLVIASPGRGAWWQGVLEQRYGRPVLRSRFPGVRDVLEDLVESFWDAEGRQPPVLVYELGEAGTPEFGRVAALLARRDAALGVHSPAEPEHGQPEHGQPEHGQPGAMGPGVRCAHLLLDHPHIPELGAALSQVVWALRFSAASSPEQGVARAGLSLLAGDVQSLTWRGSCAGDADMLSLPWETVAWPGGLSQPELMALAGSLIAPGLDWAEAGLLPGDGHAALWRWVSQPPPPGSLIVLRRAWREGGMAPGTAASWGRFSQVSLVSPHR